MIIAPDQLPILREREGRGLVLVAGCFDPLHPGHLAYFDKARAFGPLVCAVASDDYIRQTKHRPPLLSQADRMAILDRLCDYVIAQDGTGDAGALAAVRPETYAKGIDWLDRVPEAEQAACHTWGIPTVFLEARQVSSGARLRAYQQELDQTALARFEALFVSQPPAVPWTPVTDYSFEARRAIEGPHAKLIKDVFAPTDVLDYGCGPGYLVALLAELGVQVRGYEPQDVLRAETPPYVKWLVRNDWWDQRMNAANWPTRGIWDLVIYREVNEHLTLRDMVKTIPTLCRISAKFVYGTTRFCAAPTHLLDVDTADDLDPTHISLVTRPFLDLLFVMHGFTARPDLAAQMDWKGLGRTFVFERAA
jgi:cytidyltransferase-like protein